MTQKEEGKLLSDVAWLVKIHENGGCMQVRLLKQSIVWLRIMGGIVVTGFGCAIGFLFAKQQ